jgi:hypothetical protein
LSRYLCRTYKVAMLSQSMIGAETGIKTIAAVHGQCRLWVNRDRAISCQNSGMSAIV